MRVGLIDVDSHNYPNLPLMKLSAWHKAQGDNVEWYEPMWGGHYDRVYLSKVFSFSPDYLYPINADEVIYGGTGYCINLANGKETFDKSKNRSLPAEVEHIMPDYSLYGETDTAYGFMSRGCPRGCSFCHVAAKEGRRSIKVADLEEFWTGQRHIELLDPNTLACSDQWADILTQLARSGAKVNFNQGIDIRLMTEEKAEALAEVKTEMLHFAWDRYEDKDLVLPKFEMFKRHTSIKRDRLRVYVLCNYDTTIEQDLERIYTLRDIGYDPYVMLYDKEHLEKGCEYLRLQRWVNNKFVFRSVDRFEDYIRRKGA